LVHALGWQHQARPDHHRVRHYVKVNEDGRATISEIIEGVRYSAENADTITGVSCIIPKGLLKNDQNTITKDSSKQDVMGYRKAVSAQDALRSRITTSCVRAKPKTPELASNSSA
jgi:hypothetical protein